MSQEQLQQDGAKCIVGQAGAISQGKQNAELQLTGILYQLVAPTQCGSRCTALKASVVFSMSDAEVP